MGAVYSPIDLARAAGKLTELARQSGYADWDGDSSELFMARAARRLMDNQQVSYEQAQYDVAHAVLSQRKPMLIIG